MMRLRTGLNRLNYNLFVHFHMHVLFQTIEYCCREPFRPVNIVEGKSGWLTGAKLFLQAWEAEANKDGTSKPLLYKLKQISAWLVETNNQ